MSRRRAKSATVARWWHLAHEPLHHLAVAMVVASVLLIIDSFGYLNWLDSFSLRAASTLSAKPLTVADQPQWSADAPRVLLISERMYETEFQQISPLDRKVLARLLENVGAQAPRAIVIDLDISPVQALTDDPLDKQLIELAKKTRLVLATPFTVATPALREKKREWMQRLCRANVHFGFAHLAMSQGMVLRYPQEMPLLGMLARPESASDAVCRLVEQGEEKAFFLAPEFDAGLYFASDVIRKQAPIDMHFLAGSASVLHRLNGSGDALSEFGLQDKVVFLGSAYDPRDVFVTPFGIVQGSVLHSAVYFSELSPKKLVGHGAAFLFDLVVGVAAGFLFGATWGRYNVAIRAAEEHPADWGRYLLARGLLLFNFFILLLSILLLFRASAWLLQADYWNNPGPVLLGMFIKSLLASRKGLTVKNESHGHGASPAHFLPAYTDWFLALPLVAWALFILLNSHH